MADNIEAVAKKLYEKARQSSVLLSEQLHRFVKDPDPRYEVFTKPLPEWGELDGTLKEIYLIEARQIDTLCQKRIEQVGKRLRDYQKTGFVWAQELERITRDCEAKEVSNG